ncbi:branched-chain amino acid aminotransferase [Rothia aerolata]|uniref:Branched-chain-amino-acid aminotransferase n=1 Tax=Rothia aerolata TaxID=1812262 RepID=A0A917MQV7_9MICC|nr:branched-chain amino acid aminotransferase [Rothia aerolata]GGH58920.1 branched-chain-amino-acid aminotransferase [Rothia aerolata]
MSIEFTVEPNQNPASDARIEEIFADPGFGNYFTDHMATVDWEGTYHDGGQWKNARITAYGPLSLDPAAAVFHYGQEVFEGIKAYRHSDGSIWAFRPEVNAVRLQNSARRLALPELPEEIFLESVKQLVSIDQKWIPTGEGESLYIRPFMIATEAYLGVRPSHQVKYMVIASPVGNYFGTPKPVDIWLSTNYARAGVGGTGAAKCGGNYAASMIAQLEGEEQGCQQVIFKDPNRDDAIEELGGMNVFYVFGKENKVVTPELTGTILEGVTRKSLLQLAEDRGMTVEERKFTLTEWREGVANGDITEVFACGTAAVVSPVGKLKAADFEIPSATGEEPGEISMALREELVGIQTGKIEDRHGWLTRLA